MKPRIPRVLVALIALPWAAAGAQQPTSGKSIDSVLSILRLPRTTTEARTKGVPDSQVGGILDVLRRSKVPAGDAEEILRGEVEATAAGQSRDDFGAFVQAQHRAGLRGRALADAIHAEQARRGVGRGKAKHGDNAAAPETPRSRSRPDTAGAPQGRSGERGRKP